MAAGGLGARAPPLRFASNSWVGGRSPPPWPDATPRAEAAASGEPVVLGRGGLLPRRALGPHAGLGQLRRRHVVGHRPRVVLLGVQARRVAPAARSAVHAQARGLDLDQGGPSLATASLASACGRGARVSSARTTAPAPWRRVGEGPRRVDLQRLHGLAVVHGRATERRCCAVDAAPIRVEGHGVLGEAHPLVPDAHHYAAFASKDDPEIRAPLAEAGVVPLLAAQLSTAVLLNISISAREQVASAPGLLDALTAALRTGAAHHAAATVHSLLCAEAHRAAIGARRPLLAALVVLLRAPPSTRATKDALKALFAVALYPPNRATLVSLGAVQALFALVITDPRHGIVEDATAVVAQVAGCAESLKAFRWVFGVRVLLDLVEPGGAEPGGPMVVAAA